MTKPFVPTHRLKDDIPALRLQAGTPLRQINPFAGYSPSDQLLCLDENDWNNRRKPWIFTPAEIEPLENWPDERQKMIDNLTKH